MPWKNPLNLSFDYIGYCLAYDNLQKALVATVNVSTNFYTEVWKKQKTLHHGLYSSIVIQYVHSTWPDSRLTSSTTLQREKLYF